MDNFWFNAIFSVVPTIFLGILFWLIIRSMVRGDRTEREVYARIEAEERAKRGMPATDESAK